MDKQRAIKLLDNTFNSDFDINKFTIFIKELFNNFNVNIKRWLLWKEYQDYIESYQCLGSYTDASNKIIDVLVVKLKKTTSRDRARTMQRNFVAKYLSNADKDAALIAFYGDDPQDWRFSFVKMEYSRVKDDSGKVKIAKELTPAKRYSFLVGVNEPNHTAQQQLLPLLIKEETNPTIDEIEKAFSIEKVTKDFFEDYKKLYLDLKEHLEKIIKKDAFVKQEFEEKSISTADFCKKLMGQIVFLYFLQKKGWLGVQKDEKGRLKDWGTGPKDFMQKLFEKAIKEKKNFFNDFLEPLFYEALATERDDDYYSRFECKIPFLNGGLFEAINEYNWRETIINLDNVIFEQILKTFNTFNFTVKEDEPLEKEVAVDPEMLGKVFENLLDVKDRKSKGAFYTPREIVHYMCQQSLINYLETNTGIPREDIDILINLQGYATAEDERLLDEISYLNHQLSKGINVEKNAKELEQKISKLVIPKTIIVNKEKIDKLLSEIKVVDPAVGSGAFLIGILNEIVKAKLILSLFLRRKISDYGIKREIIENCLYGVDIERSAVDITQLRFWLSLIVDELYMKNIKPLPNLDHKIMCGNSLLEEFEGVKLFDENLLGEVKKNYAIEIRNINDQISKLIEDSSKDNEMEINRLEKQKKNLEQEAKKDKTSSQMSLNQALQNRIKESQKKLAELKKLQKEYFNEQNRKVKKQLRADIDRIEWELIEETLKEQGNEEAMQKLEQYKKNKAKPFFLWKLYFAEVFQRENPGFDVVIANPPYVSAWSMEADDPSMRDKIKSSLRNYDFLTGHWDLYLAFVARGDSLLRIMGSLSYIMPNPILREKYATDVRRFFLEKMQLHSILEFNDTNVFENVARRTSVLISIKNQNKGYIIKIYGNKQTYGGSIVLTNTIKMEDWLKNYNYQYLIKGNQEEDKLILKLEQKSEKIGNYFYVNYGAQVSSKIKNKFQKKDVISKKPIGNAKRFFEGKDVHRWVVSYRDLWLDYKPNEMYGPRVPELFENDKIVIRHLSDKNHRLAVALDTSKRYCDHGLIILIPYEYIKNTSLRTDFEGYIKNEGSMSIKYVLALLLSKLTTFYFRKKFATESLQGSTSHTYPASVRALLIKNILSEQQKPFIQLVDQILNITKDDNYLDNSDKQIKVRMLEKEIDQIVYNLYELTPKEIKIVEEFGKKQDD